jgi:hypothetical protein
MRNGRVDVADVEGVGDEGDRARGPRSNRIGRAMMRNVLRMTRMLPGLKAGGMDPTTKVWIEIVDLAGMSRAEPADGMSMTGTIEMTGMMIASRLGAMTIGSDPLVRVRTEIATLRGGVPAEVGMIAGEVVARRRSSVGWIPVGRASVLRFRRSSSVVKRCSSR